MVLILIAVAVALVTCLWLLIRRPPHPADQLPGPPTIPFLGNALLFAKPRLESFQEIIANGVKYGPFYRIWLSKFIPIINPLDPKDVETILSSSVHITKSYEYMFLSDWLGDGLITTTGDKWHARRKLLTPAFHFNILEQFVPVFCDKSRILVEKLKDAANSNPDGIDIVPYMTNCTFDIICETAMGYPVNAQSEKYTEFLETTLEMQGWIYYRAKRPWLFPNWIFKFTPSGRKYYKCIKILHDFTDMVIRERKDEMKLCKQDDSEVHNIECSDIGQKKRIAFLDLLLQTSEQDSSLTDTEIRAEVDTFMFAGHDTTAMAMSFITYFLSIDPEIQARCLEELEEIFSGSDRDPNLIDLNNMKYLERVIKESLRLRSPAWFIGRKLEKSIKFEGCDEFPANTVIHVNLYSIHHSPELYPDPEKFDPDRFLPENCAGRHPYAYIPFSAGPRNCIGQRFAMLEMKTVTSNLLRHFRLESCDPVLHGVACPDLILRPYNGVYTRLHPR